MPLSARPCPSKFRYDRDGWLEAVSVSDWIMALPHDPDYISPFQMQGCMFP